MTATPIEDERQPTRLEFAYVDRIVVEDTEDEDALYQLVVRFLRKLAEVK